MKNANPKLKSEAKAATSAAPSLPMLLRQARASYGRAMRDALEAAGFDDIPASGLYVIGALAAAPAPLSRLIAELGISKQAAGQLVDTLVLRGYLQREVDETDRRRLRIALSPRGQAAATTQAGARDSLDAALAERIGATRLRQLRQALALLAEIGRQQHD